MKTLFDFLKSAFTAIARQFSFSRFHVVEYDNNSVAGLSYKLVVERQECGRIIHVQVIFQRVGVAVKFLLLIDTGNNMYQSGIDAKIVADGVEELHLGPITLTPEIVCSISMAYPKLKIPMPEGEKWEADFLHWCLENAIDENQKRNEARR